MAFSLFSKPSNKPKAGEVAAKAPAAEVRPANDSKRQESEPPKAAPREPSGPRKEKGNSTVLLGVSKDWRPAYSKIEVDESRTTLCSALENAALLFASGQTDAARATLEDAVVNDHEARVSMLAWLALFDVLQRMGDKTAVDDLALKFVVAFERSPPVWDDARRATRDPATTEAKSQGSAFVRFSGELAMDNPGLESFSKAIGTSSKCRIDFSGIHSADEDASGKLAEMLRNLRRKSYSMQVQGGDALRRVLEARVRVGEPVGESYWALLLELLQWLQDSAEFEEQAVNYAISFEVSPPSWEGLTEQQVSQARIAAAEPGLSVPGASDTYVLEGVLTGPGESQVMRVREFAKDNPTLTIDCSRLERIDFVCAGALLNELEGVERAHKPIQLVSASPVVQALLLVIGIKARYFHPRLQ